MFTFVTWWLILSVIAAVAFALFMRRNGQCVRCGHTASAHEHYRRGSDCGQCKCPGLVQRD